MVLSRKVNFSAGPSTLPKEILEQIRDEIVDFRGEGLSIIEASPVQRCMMIYIVRQYLY